MDDAKTMAHTTGASAFDEAQERIAFEEWARDLHWNLIKMPNGSYYDRDAMAGWAAWRRRAKTTASGVYEVDLPGFDPRIRDALLHAETWIGSVPHGDNCYVSDHYAGGPGNRCNCGKKSALSSIEQALECLDSDGAGGKQ